MTRTNIGPRTSLRQANRVVLAGNSTVRIDPGLPRRQYNAFGYLQAVQRGSQALWQSLEQDAAQRVTLAQLGNGLRVSRSYSPWSTRQTSGRVQTAGGTPATRLSEDYLYDAIGSVRQRSQHWDNIGFLEDFSYDALNRLATSTVVGQPVQSFTYDAAGNLLSKTGVGAYTYPAQGPSAVRPHAVTRVGLYGAEPFVYDANGNLEQAPGGRVQSWTSFDMPAQLKKGSASSSYVYGPERQRVLMRREVVGDYTVYAGGQEVERKASGELTVKTYWPMGLGVEIDKLGGATPGSQSYWTHVDRLGSPVALTNAAGELVEKLAYDAWGKRRSLAGDATPDALDGVVDNKGFTRHEMLDHLDLVHMNGRVYDPLTAKFLSGDPLIQDPMNGQNYSRYTYVFNNPTNLTDPTGFAAEGCAASRICQMQMDKAERYAQQMPDTEKAKLLAQHPGIAARMGITERSLNREKNVENGAGKPNAKDGGSPGVGKVLKEAATQVGSYISSALQTGGAMAEGV